MQVLNFSALSSCKVCILRAGYLFSCLSTVFLLLSSGLRNVARYLSRHNTTRDATIVDVLFLLALIRVGSPNFNSLFLSLRLIGTTIFFF